MNFVKDLSIGVNSVLFPAPAASYEPDNTSLVWIPRFAPAAHDMASETTPCWLSTPSSNSYSSPARMLIFYLHGNGEDVGQVGGFLDVLANYFNCNVLGVEYPGYGCAPGRPSEQSIDDTVCAAWNYVRYTLRYEPHRVVIFGRSLGTGPAVRLCARLCGEEGAKVGCMSLILQSPYTSLKAAARHVAGFAASFMIERWNSLSSIQNVTCPTLLLAGARDDIVPLAMAVELLEACAASRKRLHIAERATHNESWDVFSDIILQIEKSFGVSGPSGADTIALQHPHNKASWQESLAHANVVLVGAGPVGLWCAICIKAAAPILRVLLLEKHSEYQRRHIVRVDLESFAARPSSASIERMLDSLPFPKLRTSTLESRLLSCAAELGIEVIHENVDDIRAVARVLGSNLPIHANPPVLIGSDGSHSVVRRVFGGENAQNLQYKTLQCIVDLKYDVMGETKALDFVKHAYATMKSIERVCDEHVGKFNATDRCTPITLRFVVTEDEFELLRDASFKTPYELPKDLARLPKRLLRAINIWLNVRMRVFGDKRRRGSEKLTSLRLSCYRLHRFTARILRNGQKPAFAFLVGDALFGVPFFRALNNGILCGTRLADTVVRLGDDAFASMDIPLLAIGNKSEKPPTVPESANPGAWWLRPFQFSLASSSASVNRVVHASIPRASASTEVVASYEQFVNSLIDAEWDVAHAKSAALDMGQVANRINGVVPWQINRWSSTDMRRFESQNAFDG